MTCIVGLEAEDGVYIGADSASANGWSITATRLQKVFRRNGFLIGYTTSFRMGQLLQYRLDVRPQKDDEDDLEYMVVIFVEAVRKCLKDGGFSKVEDKKEEGGRFLVGYRGKLYKVDKDFQVNSSIDGFMAVGCGADFALGTYGRRDGRAQKSASEVRWNQRGTSVVAYAHPIMWNGLDCKCKQKG